MSDGNVSLVVDEPEKNLKESVSEKNRVTRTIKVRLRVRDLYSISEIDGVVNLGISIHLYWNDSNLISKCSEEINWAEVISTIFCVTGKYQVWNPDIVVTNALEWKREEKFWELLDPATGSIKQKIELEGSIKKRIDLIMFPFDNDTIVIQSKK
jgi:hypothetical protein